MRSGEATLRCPNARRESDTLTSVAPFLSLSVFKAFVDRHGRSPKTFCPCHDSQRAHNQEHQKKETGRNPVIYFVKSGRVPPSPCLLLSGLCLDGPRCAGTQGQPPKTPCTIEHLVFLWSGPTAVRMDRCLIVWHCLMLYVTTGILTRRTHWFYLLSTNLYNPAPPCLPASATHHACPLRCSPSGVSTIGFWVCLRCWAHGFAVLIAPQPHMPTASLPPSLPHMRCYYYTFLKKGGSAFFPLLRLVPAIAPAPCPGPQPCPPAAFPLFKHVWAMMSSSR